MRISGVIGRIVSWLVIAAWAVIAGVMALHYAGHLGAAEDNNPSHSLPRSAESTEGLDRLGKVHAPSEVTTTVVYHRPGGLTTSDFRKISRQAREIAKMYGVAKDDRTGRAAVLAPASPAQRKALAEKRTELREKRTELLEERKELRKRREQLEKKRDEATRAGLAVPAELRSALARTNRALAHKIPAMPARIDPDRGLVSKDRTVATTQVVFNFTTGGTFEKLPAAVSKLRDMIRISGVETHVSGVGGNVATQAEAFQGIDGILLVSAAGVVILLLLITYRSPVLWILPLLGVGCALVTSMGVTYLLTVHAGLTVTGLSRAILYVLVFGAGTDYALLLIARYREELRTHRDRYAAMAVALRRACPAIIASAATVALGMLCLMVAELNSTAGLGPVCAVGIGICLVVMLTLLPALLVVFGRWIFWPVRPTYGSTEPTATGLWSRIGRRISRRPRLVWVVTAAILVLCCGGLLRLDAGGLSGADQYTRSFDNTAGDRVMAEHHLADQSNPMEVVSNPGTAHRVARALTKAGFDPTIVSAKRGQSALVTAPAPGDATSEKAYDAVRTVRATVHDVRGADAQVTGYSATNLDVRDATDRDSRVIIPLVLGVVLLVLMLLLRAIVAPLLLIVTVVLSFGAALGLSTAIFTWVLGFPGADPYFPLYAFVFLVALGIDYNIFLMTRVREETASRGTRQGALVALGATGGVITSAGIVLAATFAVLATLPLTAFVEIGIAVAIGVLLDTLVVRSVLVTALNLDLGRAVWWPSRLDRGRRAVEPAPQAST
ncbi:MMPL family transporter [Nocardioides cheoyonin]|uniref:MMPL family transporter n=1 Tax=Nocardioides cheoyonin TaxID=3156615 RepID=UPI0032B5ACD5